MSEKRPAEDPWLEEEEPPAKPWWKSRRAVILGVAIVAALAFIFSRGRDVAQQQAPKTASAISVVVPYTPAVTEAKAAAALPAPAPEPTPLPPQIILPAVTALSPQGQAAPPSRPAMTSYAVPAQSKPPPHPAGDPEHPAKTGIKFATATLPGSKASPAIDDTYILMPGLLPIVLDTAIDSNLPGPIMGHLPGPVYSPKGVVLMEAGTQIMGRYQSLTHNGSERLHATSLFAVTPNGVWVKFPETPFADDLGRTGLSGTVDHRYFERFGGAVLLDLSHAALGILQASVAQSGNTYLSFNGTQGLASQILQSEIQKPPIFTKSQGATIALWITEPIDFSDSYKVVAR